MLLCSNFQLDKCSNSSIFRTNKFSDKSLSESLSCRICWYLMCSISEILIENQACSIKMREILKSKLGIV